MFFMKIDDANEHCSAQIVRGMYFRWVVGSEKAVTLLAQNSGLMTAC